MASFVDFAYYAGLLFTSPWLVYKLAHPRGRRHLAGIRQRLGDYPMPAEPRRPCIWIHGVSVGEIQAARTLVEALERAHPNCEIVLTTTTGTGQEVARRTYPGRRVYYFPLDFTWAVRRAFRAIRPDLVILVELEIWPNFLQIASRLKVPVAVVNGRITHKSYRGYRLVRGWLFDPIGNIARFCVQTERYAERFRLLGIPKRHIHVTGSVKYDMLGTPPPPPTRAEVGIGEDDLVLMGGSTHPGEEQALLESYRELRQAFPRLRLILVPRHTERTPRVRALVAELADGVALRTERLASGSTEPLAPGQVLLVDTVGELGPLYGVADVVFVGGSLIPHGGQNMLEPVMLGKPTVFGPYSDNFKEPVERLRAAEGAREVSGPGALTAALRELLEDPDAAAAMARRGREALEAAQGATRETARILEGLLAGGSGRRPRPQP